MFDELNDLIKADAESQEKFKKFRINFRESRKAKSKEDIRRARITAIVLGLATTVSLLFLIFAFSQYSMAEQARDDALRLETELKECRDLQD